MIAAKAKCIGSSERSKVILTIVPTVARPIYCRLKQPAIPQPIASTKERKLLPVTGANVINTQPNRLWPRVHFAKVLNVS